MESLQDLECFVRSAEAGSFAKAARALGLTPAAVSKRVAKLEGSLGIRLFTRTTRQLALTEDGARFLEGTKSGLALLHQAVAGVSSSRGAPTGTLKASLAWVAAHYWLLPDLGRFLAKYPGIVPDFEIDNRPVDLVGGGYDAAVGGGFELPPGVKARRLAPGHRVLLASKAFLASVPRLKRPEQLAGLPGLLVRSPRTGRVPTLPLRNANGEERPITLAPRVLLGDPDSCCRVALSGAGIALASMGHALSYLERGDLVRVLPEWWVDAGQLAVYFPDQAHLPAKTRVFVDFVVDVFARNDLARRLDATQP